MFERGVPLLDDRDIFEIRKQSSHKTYWTDANRTFFDLLIQRAPISLTLHLYTILNI